MDHVYELDLSRSTLLKTERKDKKKLSRTTDTNWAATNILPGVKWNHMNDLNFCDG